MTEEWAGGILAVAAGLHNELVTGLVHRVACGWDGDGDESGEVEAPAPMLERSTQPSFTPPDTGCGVQPMEWVERGSSERVQGAGSDDEDEDEDEGGDGLGLAELEETLGPGSAAWDVCAPLRGGSLSSRVAGSWAVGATH
jgi:hypothetical protein